MIHTVYILHSNKVRNSGLCVTKVCMLHHKELTRVMEVFAFAQGQVRFGCVISKN